MRWKFIDDRTANRGHTCTKCGDGIGRGDGYLRTAVPPWATGDGFWIVIKECFYCRGNPS